MTTKISPLSTSKENTAAVCPDFLSWSRVLPALSLTPSTSPPEDLVLRLASIPSLPHSHDLTPGLAARVRKTSLDASGPMTTASPFY